jgi:hypothetical protein
MSAPTAAVITIKAGIARASTEHDVQEAEATSCAAEKSAEMESAEKQIQIFDETPLPAAIMGLRCFLPTNWAVALIVPAALSLGNAILDERRWQMTNVLKVALGVAALSGMVIIPLSAKAECNDCSRPSSTRVNTSYSSKTVRQVNNVTRYKDVNNTRHVTHTRRIVNVTRVQPVTRVNVVTRVHNRTKVLTQNQNVAQTKTLPGVTQTVNGGTRRVSHGSGSNKVDTVYKYHTVQQVRNVTQYRDVNKTKVIKQINRHVTVTNVQPVTRVNLITRVHDRVVVHNKVENVSQRQVLPTRTITTAKTVQINHPTVYGSCGCR